MAYVGITQTTYTEKLKAEAVKATEQIKKTAKKKAPKKAK